MEEVSDQHLEDVAMELLNTIAGKFLNDFLPLALAVWDVRKDRLVLGDSQMALLVISPGFKPVLPLQLHEETGTLPVDLPSVLSV